VSAILHHRFALRVLRFSRCNLRFSVRLAENSIPLSGLLALSVPFLAPTFVLAMHQHILGSGVGRNPRPRAVVVTFFVVEALVILSLGLFIGWLRGYRNGDTPFNYHPLFMSIAYILLETQGLLAVICPHCYQPPPAETILLLLLLRLQQSSCLHRVSSRISQPSTSMPCATFWPRSSVSVCLYPPQPSLVVIRHCDYCNTDRVFVYCIVLAVISISPTTTATCAR
jgi:hypothetical protein